jgi:predicted transposase YdaD
MAEGRAEGREERSAEIAKEMLARGYGIKEIAEITRMSEKEITNVKL